MKKFPTLFLIAIITLALFVRGGVMMSMQNIGCADGVCAADQHAAPMSDCLDHCLANGMLHPIDGVTASTLLLLACALALVPLMRTRVTMPILSARGHPSSIRTMLAHERLATDILRN